MTLNPDHLERLRRDDWNFWRQAHPDVRPELAGLKRGDLDLRGRDLRHAVLHGAILAGGDLRNADLGCAELSDVDLQEADLRGSGLRRAVLHRALLERADVRGADLTGADLSYTSVSGLRLGRTKLRNLKFHPDHSALTDGADSLRLGPRDRLLHWGRLRAIGRFPVFSVSWTVLILSVAAVNGIRFLNERMLLDLSSQPIPVPDRMLLILISSLLLVVGSTLFRIACPLRVQEFSETEWVESQRQPRLLYLAESLKRRGQWATLLLTVSGGLLGLYVASERVWRALRYVVETYELPGL